MAQHTPGPWNIKEVYQENIIGGRLCVFPANRIWGDPAIADAGYHEANARLLSTAPDLLEALTRLLAAYEADKNISPDMPVIISWETNGGAITEARAAIAKATGTDAGEEGAELSPEEKKVHQRRQRAVDAYERRSAGHE